MRSMFTFVRVRFFASVVLVRFSTSPGLCGFDLAQTQDWERCKQQRRNGAPRGLGESWAQRSSATKKCQPARHMFLRKTNRPKRFERGGKCAFCFSTADPSRFNLGGKCPFQKASNAVESALLAFAIELPQSWWEVSFSKSSKRGGKWVFLRTTESDQ